MSFPGSPLLLKAGIVLVAADNGAVQRVVNLQYNPETLTRTLQVQGVGADAGDRSETLRLKGPPIETIKLDAAIDAIDQLEQPAQHPTEVALGIGPALAALETMVYPPSGQHRANRELAGAGTLEIVPVIAPLAMFVWSKSRVMPVRITEFSITEEAFDPRLNPILAKVSLGMRVLSVDDLRVGSFAASVFTAYQRGKESMAARAPGALSTLGISGVL